MSTIWHDKCSCVHAHEQIVQKICMENRKYVCSLSLKFEKDLLHGCGEICLENDSKVFVSLSVLKLFVRIEVIAATRALGGLFCFTRWEGMEY